MLRFETLTLAPIDMRLVDFEILTNNEISWLNTYHAQVLKKIGPQLESADLTWLEKSTKPLKL
jgi:Xaa-Pro aminopeptidase